MGETLSQFFFDDHTSMLLSRDRGTRLQYKGEIYSDYILHIIASHLDPHSEIIKFNKRQDVPHSPHRFFKKHTLSIV